MTSEDIHAQACLVLSRTLMSIHEMSSAPHGQRPSLDRSLRALEEDLLEQARKAVFDHSLPASFLHSRSKAFLDLLPDRSAKRLLPQADVAQLLEWVSAPQLALAIRKGYHPTRSVVQLMDHRPDDPEWDALIEGPFSEAMIGTESMNGQRNIAISGDLGSIWNTRRLMLYLQAQVRHHPKDMSGALRAALRDQSAYAVTPLVLIFAGAPVDFDMEPHPSYREIYEMGQSNHGRMQLHERHGGLEACLMLIKASEKSRKRMSAQTLYQM